MKGRNQIVIVGIAIAMSVLALGCKEKVIGKWKLIGKSKQVDDPLSLGIYKKGKFQRWSNAMSICRMKFLHKPKCFAGKWKADGDSYEFTIGKYEVAYAGKKPIACKCVGTETFKGKLSGDTLTLKLSGREVKLKRQ